MSNKLDKAKVRQAGEIIEDNSKALFILAGIGAGIYLISKVGKNNGGLLNFLFGMGGGETERQEQQDEVLEKAIKEEQAKERQSFSSGQYLVYADQINSLFKTGMGWTEDEEGVADIIGKMNNNLDVLLLIDAFGRRRWYFTAEKEMLGGWVTRYFNTSQIAYLNNKLKIKGITYRF